MMKKEFKIVYLLLFLLVLIEVILPLSFSFSEDLGIICGRISSVEEGCSNMSPSACKDLLERCADYYDKQSAQIAQDITKTIQQKNTLQNQIQIFKKKIKELETQIHQGTIKAKSLSLQIEETQASINKTSLTLDNFKNQIKNILRMISEKDRKTSIEILLSGNLSDFFSDVVYLESLNNKLNDLIAETKKLRDYLQKQKEKMDEEVTQLQKTIAFQNLQKKENEENQKQYQEYLKLTESQYQQRLKEKQEVEQKAAKIRSMLFQLIGVAVAPTFGEALEIAKMAANMTGIRPAFLLAIISQESAIGRNVGQCYLTDLNTGDGKKITTGTSTIRVMNPTRDIPHFLEITKNLGRDPYATPVSCWIPVYVKGKPYGWGGAMGPAQFIPSTWKLYEEKLKNVLNTNLPNPWAIKDSFVAAGLYLADLGATAKTLDKERIAASKYFGGSFSYATSVLKRANCIQTFIDTNTMSEECQNLIVPNG